MNYAVFVDWENLYCQCRGETEPADATHYIVDWVLRRLAQRKHRVVLARAYADWEALDIDNAQSTLALLGVRPEYVLAQRGKNSADLELSLAALEVLLTRDNIDVFVIVGGDRDYIPIVTRIREAGRRIEVAAFASAMSGDLLGLVGTDDFLDVSRLFERRQPVTHTNGSPVARATPTGEPTCVATAGEPANETPATIAGETPATIAGETPATIAGEAPTTIAGEAPTTIAGGASVESVGPEIPAVVPMARFTDVDLDRCLDLVLLAAARRQVPEVWLGPFLKNYLNDAFLTMNNAGRKALLGRLEVEGAIKIEGREGATRGGGVYHVIVINEDHARVRAHRVPLKA